MEKSRWVFTTIVLAACAHLGGPASYQLTGVSPLDPPPAWYAQVWHQVHACVGPDVRPGARFEDIRWFTAASILDTRVGVYRPGLWLGRSHTIYLTAAGSHMPGVVAHEILHDLTPGHDHEDPKFERCDPLARRQTQ